MYLLVHFRFKFQRSKISHPNSGSRLTLTRSDRAQQEKEAVKRVYLKPVIMEGGLALVKSQTKTASIPPIQHKKDQRQGFKSAGGCSVRTGIYLEHAITFVLSDSPGKTDSKYCFWKVTMTDIFSGHKNQPLLKV